LRLRAVGLGWGESITERDNAVASLDPDQSSSGRRDRAGHDAVADSSKILAGSDKHRATTLPMYVVVAAGSPRQEKTMDFWTVFSKVDQFAILVPAVVFLAWVLYTDRKIVRRNAAMRRAMRRSGA
jgi:hypothetical protein